MTANIEIANFDFSAHEANSGKIAAAWLPAIEKEIELYTPDNALTSFFISAMRVGSKAKSSNGLNINKVIRMSGYSRSTFFRRFESSTLFMLQAYQLSCELSTNVYKRSLQFKKMRLEEFADFTSTVFFGLNCTISSEVIAFLWETHQLSHTEFHPHLADVSSVIYSYLKSNDQTRQVNFDAAELSDFIRTLDLDMITARIERNPEWGKPAYYKKLHRMLLGYLSSFNAAT